MRDQPLRAWRYSMSVGVALACVAAIAPGVAAAQTTPLKVPPTKPFNARTVSRLNRALRVTWASTWSPGMIVGVWVGKHGWTSTLGSTERAAGPRPILADHTRVGSVTKTFIGTLILRLVDQHKLRLDETIQQWFPTLPDASQITIRELGDMSSGISSYTTDTALTDKYFAHPMTWWSPNELIASAAALPRMFTPGDGFDYSDTNFVLLGRIIEKVTHEPLNVVMREDLFKPLGMNASSYPTSNRLPRPFLRGYTVQGSELGNVLDSTGWSPSFAAGAGQAISTLRDLHRWTIALGTGALLEPATQLQRLIPNPHSEGGGRAYLFAVGREDGWLAHEGETPGFNTQVAYLPALKASIVVITNSDISNAKAVSPAAAMFSALARVIAPKNVPAS